MIMHSYVLNLRKNLLARSANGWSIVIGKGETEGEVEIP